MWRQSGLEAHVIGYDHHHQASEARRSAKWSFAPTIGFADLLRSLGSGSYSLPMVPGSSSGSAGSVGSGVSRASSGGCSVSPACPLLRSSRSTRAIRSWSCSSEASRSCWSESNCWSSGSTVLTFPSVPSSVYPSSPRAYLSLRQSSYFCPLGLVAPLRDSHAANCFSDHPQAPVRSAPVRSAFVRSTPVMLTSLKLASFKYALVKLAPRSRVVCFLLPAR